MHGELVWRMPLHPDYKELTRGKVADLVNASEQRKASSAYAASFLEEFPDGKPWAHLDIAGVGLGSGQSRLRRQGRERLGRAPARRVRAPAVGLKESLNPISPSKVSQR